MAMTEDAATVLEDWVQTVANLPAEIQHVLEEIQAKDRTASDHRSKIATHDVGLQKHVKANGCSQANPKEDAACKTVSSLYDTTQVLQDEKVSLSERAATLLDRQIKRLDIKIRDLQNDGSIQPDPQLPSLLNSHVLHGRLPPLSNTPTGTNTPLNPLTGGTGSTAPISNASVQRLAQQPSNRQPSPLSTTAAIQAHNLNAHRQNARSPSADNTKRRRLNAHHLNLPATSSNLRQSSLGPGTPKAGADSTIRSGSAGPRSTTKKAGRGGAVPQRITHLNPASANKKPGPAARRRARQKSGTPASTRDDASVDGSQDAEGDEDVEMEDRDQENDGEGEDEEDDGDGDDRKYCTCRSVSYGNMVACDNDDCPYEWFHWSCVGITSEPKGKWYCPECKRR